MDSIWNAHCLFLFLFFMQTELQCIKMHILFLWKNLNVYTHEKMHQIIMHDVIWNQSRSTPWTCQLAIQILFPLSFCDSKVSFLPPWRDGMLFADMREMYIVDMHIEIESGRMLQSKYFFLDLDYIIHTSNGVIYCYTWRRSHYCL
jgi:hypothetical protein